MVKSDLKDGLLLGTFSGDRIIAKTFDSGLTFDVMQIGYVNSVEVLVARGKNILKDGYCTLSTGVVAADAALFNGADTGVGGLVTRTDFPMPAGYSLVTNADGKTPNYVKTTNLVNGVIATQQSALTTQKTATAVATTTGLAGLFAAPSLTDAWAWLMANPLVLGLIIVAVYLLFFHKPKGKKKRGLLHSLGL